MSILAVMGHWIDKSFVMKERLLICVGFSSDRHTGDNIEKQTLKGLHETWGIGESPEDVPNNIFGSTPDEGSNMLKAWKVFEGSGCVTHRGSSALKAALSLPCVRSLVSKVKGIIAHFHRSTKVSMCLIACLNVYTVVYSDLC